jgi:Mg2+-importing ATPase
MKNISRSLDRGRITDILRFIVLIGPGTSTIDLAIFFHNWFYYCLQSGTLIKVIEVFQSGLVSSRDSAPNPHSSHPSHCKLPVTRTHCAKSIYINAFLIPELGVSTACVPPIAIVLQMAGRRECSTPCSMIYWLGSRWFFIRVKCFTSKY